MGGYTISPCVIGRLDAQSCGSSVKGTLVPHAKLGRRRWRAAAALLRGQRCALDKPATHRMNLSRVCVAQPRFRRVSLSPRPFAYPAPDCENVVRGCKPQRDCCHDCLGWQIHLDRSHRGSTTSDNLRSSRPPWLLASHRPANCSEWPAGR